MKKRLMLPVMAFVFAIGLSFATERSTADLNVDYVDMGDGEPTEIAEVNCGQGDILCTGVSIHDGTEYQIFDGPGLTNPKVGAGTLIPIDPGIN